MIINKDPSNLNFESYYPYWMGRTQLLTRGGLFLYYNSIGYLASTIVGKQPMNINKDPSNPYFELYYPYWRGRTQFLTRGELSNPTRRKVVDETFLRLIKASQQNIESFARIYQRFNIFAHP